MKKDVAPSSSFLSRVKNTLIPASAKQKQLEKSLGRMHAFIAAVPFEYCGWNTEGVQVISPHFTHLLSAEKIDHVDDLYNALNISDAAALKALYTKLCNDGSAFDLTVTTLTGLKVIRLFGKRGGDGLDAQNNYFSVLWAQDITHMANRLHEAEDAVQNATLRQEEFKTALNHLPIALWRRNQKLDITWCNRTYAQWLDESTATIVAEQKEFKGSGKNKDWTARLLSQQALAKKTPQSERQHIVMGGKRHLLEIHETALPDQAGMIGSALDVTREDDLLADLARSSQNQKDVLEQLRTAIAIFDRDTKLEFYNSAFEQLFGLENAWLNTHPKLPDLFDRLRQLRRLPEQIDFRAFKQQWLAKFTSLLTPEEEMMYLPDGGALRLVTLPRPSGGLILNFDDVTSHLKLETSYNILVAVQKETIDSLSDGLIVYGEDGRVKLSNPAFAHIFHLAPEIMARQPHISELTDKTRHLFHEHDWPNYRQTLIHTGLNREPLKGTLMLRNGTIIAFTNTALPDGNVLNIFKDITSIITAEKTLLESNEALREAEKLKTNFLANVSYQLRTPINVLVGFAEILNQQYFGKMNDKQLEYTYGMIEAGQRLINLVDDILDLSSIEAGYMNLSLNQLDVRELLDSIGTITEEWIRREGLKLTISCPRTVGTIIADERRLKQAILNLISNAITYSEGAGTITLFASRLPEHMEIGVMDEGIGILDQDLERVFSPFERGENTKTNDQTGAGLGLSLVKSIIHLHHGDVKIEQIRDPATGALKGTRISCLLPI